MSSGDVFPLTEMCPILDEQSHACMVIFPPFACLCPTKLGLVLFLSFRELIESVMLPKKFQLLYTTGSED